jgi:hypothetical protein
MRLAPGWLDAGDRLRLVGVRLTALALDPMTLETGTARLEARGLRWERPAGHLAGERFAAQLQFARAGATLAVDVERVATVLPALTGEVPRVTASAEMAHGAGPGLQARRATLTARDRQGQEMVVASLTPAPTAGRLRLSARAPALERLEGLWPTVSRRLNGSARLDVELAGTGYQAADGRLVLEGPEAEMWNGKVSIRDFAATVPVRRGADFSGEPPWGQLAIGELIAYGVVARDVMTPTRIYRDRLSLNDLTYALYAGNGKGWTEVEMPAGSLAARGQLTGEGVRVEEFIASYGIRGGTMTGLLRYAADYEYRAGRLQLKGHFEVPDGGAVNIELLDRLLSYTESDPTGVVREALGNLRTFDYKSAEAEVHSAADDIRVSLVLRGRERFLIFPPRVREINVRNLPLSFLARQFPGSFN